MEAFVYCWTDKQTNKLYVGSHKGAVDDGYVCSSKLVLEKIAERPDDFSRQIIAEGEWKDMRSLEAAILKAANAKTDPGFYNMTNGDRDFYFKGHTRESREQISKTKTGTTRPPFSDEWLRKMCVNRVGKKPALGMKHSEETKQRLRIKCSGANNYWYGRKRPRTECPHCLQVIDISNAKRWHFDKCKRKV